MRRQNENIIRINVICGRLLCEGPRGRGLGSHFIRRRGGEEERWFGFTYQGGETRYGIGKRD